MAGIVLDSSIALSWCLPDEEKTDQIEREVARSGAIAPSHWPLEGANALLMAERRRRITAEFRRAALRDPGALPIALDAETSVRAWHETLQLAEAYRLTAYDAAYLELAHRLALPLATLDGRCASLPKRSGSLCSGIRVRPAAGAAGAR